MKKLILTLCTGIIMCGAAYSLYNAANDYGLATVSLPPAIVAQEDDTNGGDNTNLGPCDGINIYCETRLIPTLLSFEMKSGKNNEIKFLEQSIIVDKAETYYTLLIEQNRCESDKKPNVCVKAEQGYKIVNVSEGRNTNGDSTN